MSVCVFLVHLSLKFRHRQYQLRTLHDLVVSSPKPVIVAGDFNTFWGTHEIYLFMRAAGLRSANAEGLPSFPSRQPRVELDFILVSAGIDVTRFPHPGGPLLRSSSAGLRFRGQFRNADGEQELTS